MPNLDGVTSWISNNSSSLMYNLFWFLIAAILILFVSVIVWYSLYRIKVVWFWAAKRGDKVIIDITARKKDKARCFAKDGVEQMRLFWAFKSTKAISANKRPDGKVYLVRLDRLTFIPIPPTVEIDNPELDQNNRVMIKLDDDYDADVFSLYAREHNYKRYSPDADVKRAFVILIVAIIAVTLLSGFLLYLQYKLAGGYTEQMKQSASILQNVASALSQGKTGVAPG